MRRGTVAGWAGLMGLLLLGTPSLWAEGPGSAVPELLPKAPAPADPIIPSGPPDIVPPPEAPSGESAHEEEERPFGAGLFLEADYLLVRARRNALDFALLGPSQTDTGVGSIQSLGWETRSAFRTGIGYQFPDNHWRLTAFYTNLYTSGNTSLTVPPGGQLFATLTRGGSVDDVTSAAGFTSLYYNVLDLDATRLFQVDPRLEVQAFGGGRLALIDQKVDAFYSGGSAGPTTDAVHSPVYFTGAGLTGGGQAFYKLWHNLGVYGRGRVSLLSGHFRNFLSETIGNGQVAIVNVREEYYQVVPVTDLSAGVAWQGEHWNLRVGYELVNWYNMVNSPDFPTEANIGKVERRTSNLTLESLAVQLAFLY